VGRGRLPFDSQNDSGSAIVCCRLFSKVASQYFSGLRSVELANVQGFAFSLGIRIPSIKRNPTLTRRGISDYCHSHTPPYRCADAGRCCYTSSTLSSHVVFQTRPHDVNDLRLETLEDVQAFADSLGIGFPHVSRVEIVPRYPSPKPFLRAWKAGADRSQQADG
jgi:hypothetical protein